MKEFAYAMALCFLMLTLWSFSKMPGEADIKAAPEMAEQLRHDREVMQMISGGSALLALVCAGAGWFSRSRESVTKKQLD
ncbi:MAG: hypothetical protein CMI01_08655 [Oceanospirillaceae bacterium]|jgi:hypothetical protein|uniref:hypothetical protein n=1 Tax=Marinobacterium litorale TaxID=404770 RepID=UPI000405E10F|nr:hypothetical protein [Marinobacterium litorale]MBS98733.1 hypothetical protein [Oceanospirillaceae bacterium]